MASKKKILFFMWSFSLGGGAEKILATIVNQLDPKEYDIDILEMEHFDKGYPEVPANVRILKPYKTKKHSRIVEALLWRFRIYCPNLVRRLVARDEYDVEISFTIMNPPLAFSKRPEVKKIEWIHGSIETMPENQQYYLQHKAHLQTVDTIVAISEKTRQSIEDVFPEYKDKIVTIYNGYDFGEIIEKSEQPTEEVIEPLSLCSIGRLETLKGTDRTLELMRQLHQKGYLYHLYYIGAGEQEATLKAKTKEYGLSEYIHFLGYQPNPYKYLRQVKALVSMSLQEGFSGACVESLALGKPFISTDVGGAKELSQNGQFGKIITTDEEALEAIIAYLSGQEQPDLEEMREFIEQFTIPHQMEQINQLIEL